MIYHNTCEHILDYLCTYFIHVDLQNAKLLLDVHRNLFRLGRLTLFLDVDLSVCLQKDLDCAHFVTYSACCFVVQGQIQEEFFQAATIFNLEHHIVELLSLGNCSN